VAPTAAVGVSNAASIRVGPDEGDGGVGGVGRGLGAAGWLLPSSRISGPLSKGSSAPWFCEEDT